MTFAVLTWLSVALALGWVSRRKFLGLGIQSVCGLLSALFFLAAIAGSVLIFFLQAFA
jgi:hypothetical protein